MVHRFLFASGIVALLVSGGCRLTPPNFRQPGFLYEQRLRATFHDPYAVPEAAPEFEGGRPPTFEQPRSPVVQSQWQLDLP